MIELQQVTKSFNGQKVLDGLDGTVAAGECLVVMGPSGSGKSVLLRHIIGLLRPDSGKVLVEGKSVPDLSPEELRALRRDMGYLFQSGALINWMNAHENVALPLRETTDLGEDEIRSRVQRVLALVQLEQAAEKFPSELSGGMQKRVGLARALVTEPRIILYDEPEAGLDPEMSANINRAIRQLKEELRMTSVVVTHSINCALTVGDRLAVLEHGRFLVEGTPQEVLDSDMPRVQQFLGAKRD
ncbi:MAG: ABC transporter ATP-binding protein [Planctomycetota bacterium]|nr:MAG: ABC transporter ATP-binding protein [Planctomycetota bacterium]